jgi:hypothetical protein
MKANQFEFVLVVIALCMLASCSSETTEKSHEGMGDPSAIENALKNADTNEAIIMIDEYLSRRFYEDENSLTAPEKNVVFVENVEREVNNGGFSQFFYNPTGNYAHESVDALREIGAETTAELLQKAIDQFPDGQVPKDEDARMVVLEQIGETAEKAWSKLDDEFYESEDNITALVLEYVRKNRAEFRWGQEKKRVSLSIKYLKSIFNT